MMLRRLMFAVTLVAIGGCNGPAAPADVAGSSPGSETATGAAAGIAFSATGGGHHLLQNAFDTQFAFSAVAGPDRAAGRFHQALTLEGQSVAFHGEVTCVSVDSVNRRAWVGGIITENSSAHPSFQTARHQVGKDIWFRVLDSGEGAAAPEDRITFLGFEGDAGFLTSAAYCAGQPWAENNARTWPVTSGNIQVRP